MEDINIDAEKQSVNTYDPQSNSFFIFDDITQELAENVNAIVEYCLLKDKKELKIFINSCGGDLFATVAIISAMKRIKTHTFNMGFAASAAAIIFLAGDKRTCSPYSYTMFHEGSTTIEEGNMNSIKDFLIYVEETSNLIMKELLKRTKVTFKEYLQKVNNKEWYINTKEAIRLKIADEVL